ncbi:hypothetical protein ACODT5_39535 [Streptomyces sp. 5.8]|uniref:hypothetical protein n=1 Tax=Streptomyces sp. 5.8 TaxID=3406571 RepID=UPI003BB7AC86
MRELEERRRLGDPGPAVESEPRPAALFIVSSVLRLGAEELGKRAEPVQANAAGWPGSGRGRADPRLDP